MNDLIVVPQTSHWQKPKALVLNSVSSPITRRVYNLGLDEFFAWLSVQEPRPGFTKATVSAWRVALEARGLGAVSINVRITAVRKLAVEASDNGLLAPELANGITRVKGVASKGVRLGNWLSVKQAQTLLNAPDVTTTKGLRDRAILAVLLGCGLRRSEAAALTFGHIQQRDGRWCIVDLVGKHGRVRTIPMPTWVKVAIDAWTAAAGVCEGPVFRSVHRGDQGDSREVGLDQLLRSDCSIFRAIPSSRWPGAANLEIAQLWITRGKWGGRFFINGSAVNGISSSLTPQTGGTSSGPDELAENSNKAFQGALVVGMGFILEPQEAERLLHADSRNQDVLLRYLNGEDINSSPIQSPSRWVINFFGFPVDRQTAAAGYQGSVAADYPECLAIVRERVLPERLTYEPKNPWNRKLRSEWWLFGQWRWALYDAIAPLNRVLVRSRVANINSIAFAPTTYVFSDAVVVFAFEDMGHFALLQSFAHTTQLEQYSSSLRKDVRYTPSSCFSTFPRPQVSSLESVGQLYYETRQNLMLSRQQGLTRVYNYFHNQLERSADVEQLRQLHVKMDHAVAAAYGWTDLDVGHNFHQTKQGIRYTISETARREALDRLLALNHERYAAEQAAAAKQPSRKPSARKRPPGEPTLF
jgi:site-specific recombinase XerC